MVRRSLSGNNRAISPKHPPPSSDRLTRRQSTHTIHPCIAEQAALAARVVEADPPAGAAARLSLDTLTLVGGLDVSFAVDRAESAVAALVVLSFPALDVVYQGLLPVAVAQPYAAGYLAFREAPALVALVERLKARRPELVPQVLMVDGNGVLHPRGCGLACHVVSPALQ